MRILTVLTFMVGIATGGASVHAQPASRDSVIALVGVTVIDPGANAANTQRANQTLVIADGVIRAAGPASSVRIPRGARRIYARGKFVIPGLWDAHVHFMNATASALPVYVAMGITSVREMGGYIDSTRAWQARMRAGTLVGPRILTPGSVLVYPGFALHEELRLLVEDAGLTPRDALWSATIGPARFARFDATLGTIAEGRVADLLLLDANPLVNIRNTRRIFAVVQGGRYLPRRELDAMLERVRTMVKQ